MSSKRLTKEYLYDLIRDELNERKKKNNKHTCSSRKDSKGMNRFHDADGKFSTKEDAKSSSVRSPTNKPCKYAGQGKENPHRFTRIKCGRKNPYDATEKADYRCKDGEKIREETEDITLLDEPIIPDGLRRLSKGMMERQVVIDNEPEREDWRVKYQRFVNSLTREEQREVKTTICSYNPNQMAKIINQFAKALKGDLGEQAN
tara:strand:- start:2202 stop:2810 length:609 start_codon:yes stop_codon:yes gene_type:complete